MAKLVLLHHVTWQVLSLCCAIGNGSDDRGELFFVSSSELIKFTALAVGMGMGKETWKSRWLIGSIARSVPKARR